MTGTEVLPWELCRSPRSMIEFCERGGGDVIPCCGEFEKKNHFGEDSERHRCVQVHCSRRQKLALQSLRAVRAELSNNGLNSDNPHMSKICNIYNWPSFVEALMHSHRHLAASYALQLRKVSLAGHGLFSTRSRASRLSTETRSLSVFLGQYK